MVDRLLQEGSSPTGLTGWGKSPIDVARAHRTESAVGPYRSRYPPHGTYFQPNDQGHDRCVVLLKRATLQARVKYVLNTC